MVEVGLSLSNGASLFFVTPQPLLAQVVVGTFGLPLILGITMLVGGVGLYLIRNLRPQLARDYDIALAAIAVVSGFIMVFYGWRLPPELAFGVALLTGFGGFFAFETLKLRGSTLEQAKRSSGKVVDDERPASRVYRAELDDLSQIDDRAVGRRIRSQREARSNGDDYFEDERPSRPSLRGSNDSRSETVRDRPNSSSRRRSASSPRSEKRTSRSDRNFWEEDINERSGQDSWETGDDTAFGSSIYGRSSDDSDNSSRRRRPDARRRPNADNADYVDYQPLDDYDER